jgi:hypothetical protein
MPTLNEISQQVVDPEVVMDYLVEKREFILTVRSQDLEFIKSRLSQAKFKRDMPERMSMRALVSYDLLIDVGLVSVTDLHIKLGSGTEIFVVKCSPIDNEL